jgi:hypothetical protein
MRKKIIKRKSSVKKKISKAKKRSLTPTQWGEAFEKLAHRRPVKFNFIRRENVSGDPFCGQGVPDVESFGHPSSVVDFLKEAQARVNKANKNFYETAAALPDPILASATRGELGSAPAHYSKGKFTPWEVIDDWKLGYYDGNAMKYVCRHKHKGKPVEDIQKAIDCLIKYRDNLKKELGL